MKFEQYKHICNSLSVEKHGLQVVWSQRFVKENWTCRKLRDFLSPSCSLWRGHRCVERTKFLLANLEEAFPGDNTRTYSYGRCVFTFGFKARTVETYPLHLPAQLKPAWRDGKPPHKVECNGPQHRNIYRDGLMSGGCNLLCKVSKFDADLNRKVWVRACMQGYIQYQSTQFRVFPFLWKFSVYVLQEQIKNSSKQLSFVSTCVTKFSSI